MARLILMMGVPASGKSEFAKRIQPWIKNSVIISRDEVRLIMMTDGDRYFKNEKKVFAKFCRQINEALAANKNVIVDATHINRASRKKLLSKIDSDLYSRVDIFVMQTPLAQCILNNDKREGLAKVPQKAIKDMWRRRTTPILEEGFNNIYYVFNYSTVRCVKGEERDPFV